MPSPSTSGVDRAVEALAALDDAGVNFFTGVACSLLGPLIARLADPPHPRYLPAVREDAAIGLAVGAYLAGAWPCVLMQNSGLGYSLNALTSLSIIYEIPTLLLIGYRGYQGQDAPEHWIMGRTCEAILREIGVPATVPAVAEEVPSAIHRATAWMREHRTPAAVLIRSGVLSDPTT